jgi:hypothetical protein
MARPIHVHLTGGEQSGPAWVPVPSRPAGVVAPGRWSRSEAGSCTSLKRFNDECERIRPRFLIVDIEGGEREFIRYAKRAGLGTVGIELHPQVIRTVAVAEVKAFFDRQGFAEDRVMSGHVNKLYLCRSRI